MADDTALAGAVKALRAAADLSMAQLARAAAVSKPYVQQIENGTRNPSPGVVEGLDVALGAGGLLVALSNEDDVMNRRSLLAAISVVAAGGGEHSRAFHGIVIPPGRVGRSDVEAVAASIAHCTALDLQYGGGTALQPGQAMLGWAVRMLDASVPDAVRPDLSSAVAALADRVAWSCYDAGQDDAARKIYGLALKAAQLGSDRNLRAHILISESTRQAHNRDYKGAAELLGRAVDDRALAAPVRANVGLTYARHIAEMGHSAPALDRVARSLDEETTTAAGAVPAWSAGFMGGGHLASVAARSYLFARDYDQAIAEFRTALSGLGASRARGRAYAQCLMGLAYLRGGYGDMARSVAGELSAPGLHSMRVAGHARTFAAELRRAGMSDEAQHVGAVAVAVAP